MLDNTPIYVNRKVEYKNKFGTIASYSPDD